jgi:membrane protease YdiL (CAAX protease family)
MNLICDTKMKTYYPTINQSFWLIFKLFLISIPATLPLFLFFLFKEHFGDNGMVKSFALLISYLFSFIWIIRIAKKKVEKEGHWNVKWKKGKTKLNIMFLFALITITLIILLEPITELIPIPESILEVFKEMIQPNIFSFLTIVVAAPILEELFFRGIILEGFLRNYKPWKAIIWSALVFGMAHFNPWQTIGATIMGLLLGWAYVKTKSLWPGVLIHFLNNLIGYSVIAFTKENNLLIKYTNEYISYSYLMILSIIILIIGVYTVQKKSIKHNA